MTRPVRSSLSDTFSTRLARAMAPPHRVKIFLLTRGSGARTLPGCAPRGVTRTEALRMTRPVARAHLSTLRPGSNAPCRGLAPAVGEPRGGRQRSGPTAPDAGRSDDARRGTDEHDERGDRAPASAGRGRRGHPGQKQDPCRSTKSRAARRPSDVNGTARCSAHGVQLSPREPSSVRSLTGPG